MKIVYIANHEQWQSNDDEGAIQCALTSLGHSVSPLRERKSQFSHRLSGDALLFHHWSDVSRIRFFEDKAIRAFWYFDLVDWPECAERSEARKKWMQDILPNVETGFCTDGDWVDQDTTGKLFWLPQGADDRVTGRGTPQKGKGAPILFTGISRGGKMRYDFVQEMRAHYGDRFLHVEKGVYRRDLANLIAGCEIVVAPDTPVTDRYFSNRVFVTLGFGGFLLHPYSKALAEMYKDGEEIVFYRGRDDLHEKIRHYLQFPAERHRISEAGLRRTLAEHTYRHRCEYLIQVLEDRLEKKPVFEPEFWRKRLNTFKGRMLHHAVFLCPLAKWKKIEAKHREILAQHIKPGENVLDVGCGWGRLLDLLPQHRQYIGLDISPDFIALARAKHPQDIFITGDFRDIPVWQRFCLTVGYFDWAVLISIRPMVKRNYGAEMWERVEKEIRRVAKKLLYLEYDEADGGSVE